MTYQETLSYLYESQPAFHLIGAAAYKPGLENTHLLMDHLRRMCSDRVVRMPHERFQSIHVAGTNGKGSVSHLIAATLQALGMKVGLYTSPHLVDFRERIRVNGSPIPEQEVVRFVEENRDFLDEIKPSFFETTMAMAFSYFAEQQVDIAVVEVGLGGRLDSTNIIHPLMSVITNIGLDHTEFLGHTLAEIASEKAGIIKKGVPCIIGETNAETTPVFLDRAEKCQLCANESDDYNIMVRMGHPERGIWFADQCIYLRNCRRRSIKECALQGLYQEHNKQTAYVALRVLSSVYPGLIPTDSDKQRYNILENAIIKGFRDVCTMTGLRGRWEVLRQQPLTICDTGHNPHGIEYVVKQLRQWLLHNEDVNKRLHIVLGMVSDKDVDTVLKMLPRKYTQYYFTQARTHRAIPAEELKQRAKSLNGSVYHSVEEAVLQALQNAHNSDCVFIGGSNYVVGEALSMPCWQNGTKG